MGEWFTGGDWLPPGPWNDYIESVKIALGDNTALPGMPSDPFTATGSPLAGDLTKKLYSFPADEYERRREELFPNGLIGGNTDEDNKKIADVAVARRQLKNFLITGGLIVGVPIAYAAVVAATRKKGAKITPQQEMVGRTLENASSQATGLCLTALASPVIAAAASYILVQKMEDAEYISKGLGNAAQTLLTVSAAGPAIQGIGQIAQSAFQAFTKVKA